VDDTELEVAREAPQEPARDLEAELAAARALADERLSELAYARAEIENVRRRSQRTANDAVVAKHKALLAKFLPVIDNLQRALAFEDGEGLRGGLLATLRGLENALESEGLKPLDVVGKPFDPRVAEAIATRESSEHDDVVVEEIQRGYALGDVIVRPALVVVAKAAASADSGDESEE